MIDAQLTTAFPQLMAVFSQIIAQPNKPRALWSLWPTQGITVSDINFHNHGHRRSHECKQDWRNREGDNLDWRKGSSTPFLYFLQMISLSHTTPHAGLYHTQHTRCPLDPHGPQDQYWFHIQIAAAADTSHFMKANRQTSSYSYK